MTQEALNDILSGKAEKDVRELKESQIELVLVAVRGETPEIIFERMGEVANIAVQHNGFVDSLVSSLVIVVYKMSALEESRTRFTLIEALEQAFRNDVKIVHGSESGCFGNLGSNRRMSYSFIIPGFLEALCSLANLSYGDTKHF